MSQSVPQGIPIRRVKLNHMSELPLDYGTTPGGTLFSTTPGGTRIIYDRSFLLKCRASPMSNTPPSNLPDIPGVTSPDKSPSRVLTKIEEKEIVKENGGNFWEQRHFIDVCPNAKGPLQQYRQRNFVQQNNALIEKTLQQAAFYSMANPYLSPGLPNLSQLNQAASVASRNNASNKSSGDGLWHGGQRIPQFQAAKKYPASQLSAWREAKFNQAVSQTISQTLINTSYLTPTSNVAVPGIGYRGRGRTMQQHKLPSNLCRPMQKLFMCRDTEQCHPTSTSQFDNDIEVMGMPIYGQLLDGSLSTGSIDENSNIVQ